MSGFLHQLSQGISGKLPWDAHHKMASNINGSDYSPFNQSGQRTGLSGLSGQQQSPPIPGNGHNPGGHPKLWQPLPRDVVEKRLPGKTLSGKRPSTLTPDRIRYNPIAVRDQQIQLEFISRPWDGTNHIDPFNQH